MSFAKALLLAFLPIPVLGYPDVHLFSSPFEQRVLTPDNTCGGTTNGYTCNPSLPQGGGCCSASGFCGTIDPVLAPPISLLLTLPKAPPPHTAKLAVNGTSPPQARSVPGTRPTPAEVAMPTYVTQTAKMVDLVAQLLDSVVSLFAPSL